MDRTLTFRNSHTDRERAERGKAYIELLELGGSSKV